MQIKALLLSTPVLVTPDYQKLFRPQVGASDYEVGAVLPIFLHYNFIVILTYYYVMLLTIKGHISDGKFIEILYTEGC